MYRNKLSTDCVHATSGLMCSRIRIDKYLVKAGYTLTIRESYTWDTYEYNSR